jgi:hypothetical protein
MLQVQREGTLCKEVSSGQEAAAREVQSPVGKHRECKGAATEANPRALSMQTANAKGCDIPVYRNISLKETPTEKLQTSTQDDPDPDVKKEEVENENVEILINISH